MLVSKDNKLLLGKKDSKSGGVYVDCWHIPGGGVNLHETKSDALKREILEEVGIDIVPYTSTLIDDSGTGTAEKTLKDTGEKVIVTMHFFVYRVLLVDKNSDEINVALNDDLAEYQWVRFDELSKVKLTPPSVKLFTKLGYLKA